MTFELNATAQADQIRRAATSPLDPAEFSPGFLTGAATAPFEGIGRLGAKALLLAGEGSAPILRPIARDIDGMFGTDAQGFIETQRRRNVDALKFFTPDPQTTGFAGQIINSLFDIVPSAILTGPAGAGILEGVAQKKLAEAKGVDANSASMHGVVQGAAVAVGVKLPMSLGLRTAPDLLYAAAANVAPNLAARSLSHRILADGGYKDMAAQYQALDVEAIAADAILGVAFAGAGRLMEGRAQKVQARVLYSQIDAALAAQKAKHYEVDTAPGLPRDLDARDAHVEAMTKATEALIEGRPVEVPARVADANFERSPARTESMTELQAQTRSVADDADLLIKQAEAEEAATRLARPDLLPDDLPGRVAHPDVRSELAAMRGETGWAQQGGKIMRDAMTNEVNGRTEWIANAEWWPGRPDAKTMNEAKVQAAIDKALAGEPLKAAETRLVQYLTDYIDERLLQPLREVPLEEQNALRIDLQAADLEPTQRNIVDVDLVAKASKIDEAAVERAAMQHGDNDAGFMREIKRILGDGQKQKQQQDGQADGGGEGRARAQEAAVRTDSQDGAAEQSGNPDAALNEQSGAASREAGASTKAAPADRGITDAARQILNETPDLIVADETGALVRADELMAIANDVIAGAEQDARGFSAAVTCFLRAA